MPAINKAPILVVGFALAIFLYTLSFADADQMDADNQCVAEKSGYPIDYGLECGALKLDGYGRTIALGGQGCVCKDTDANVVGHCVRLFKCHGDTCNGKPCAVTKPEAGTPSPSLGDIEFPPPPSGGESATETHPPVSNEFIQDAFGSSPQPQSPSVGDNPGGTQSPGGPDAPTIADITGDTVPWSDYVALSEEVRLSPPEESMSDFIDRQSRMLQLPEEAYTGIELFQPEDTTATPDPQQSDPGDSWWQNEDALNYRNPDNAANQLADTQPTQFTAYGVCPGGCNPVEGLDKTARSHLDAQGNRTNDIYTLDKWANGEVPYVTVAGPRDLLGQTGVIPEIQYTDPITGALVTAQNVPYEVADTGSRKYFPSGAPTPHFDVPLSVPSQYWGNTKAINQLLGSQPFSQTVASVVPDFAPAVASPTSQFALVDPSYYINPWSVSSSAFYPLPIYNMSSLVPYSVWSS